MTPSRPVWAALFAAAVVTSGAGCNPCGPPCDETVHPYPIRSATYDRFLTIPSECFSQAPGAPDGGMHVDAGEVGDGGFSADAGPVCDESVSLDADAGTVVHVFTYRGQKHVVRYRRTAVESIRKGDDDPFR